MATDYKVQQGDHLVKITARFGFGDPATIWDHPKNAALKEKRKNPNVLMPGDVLHIPDKRQKQESRPTDQTHRFSVRRPKLLLRFTLKGADEKPISGKKVTLTVENEATDLATDGNGRFERNVRPNAENGKFFLPELGVGAGFKIGHLDPVEEMSGSRARLNNLGYSPGLSDDPQDRAIRSAVEEFQCDQGLTVTGDMDPATQKKLAEAHGC